MDKSLSNARQIIERSASLAVLLILAAYTIGILFAAPYPGLYIDPSTGRISALYVDTDLLHKGDRVLQAGSITWDEYRSDGRVVLFAGLEPGKTIEIRVERNGKPVTVSWTYPGFNLAEFNSRVFNVWFLAFAFWLAGFIAHLSIRPYDTRRALFIAANYITALWLSSGSLSSSHLWESSTILHASSWLMMPVYLHLHWVFPYPFKSSWKAWAVLYGIALFGAVGEFFHVFPRSLFQFAFLIAILGSFLLLIAHYRIQPQGRGTLRLLFLSFALAFLPSIFLTVFFVSGSAIREGLLSFLFLPFMPLAYFYLIHRGRLSGMETKVNRIISTYIFLILLGMVFFAAIIITIRMDPSQESWIGISAVLTLMTALSSAAGLPAFQRFIDQHLFGIKLPYQNLPETYSSRIAACDNLPSLLALLRDEVFPSLLVRQYAFLQSQDRALSALLAKDTSDAVFDFDLLSQKAGHYIPNLPPNAEWTRLVLPLKVGDKTLGFWLLGKRDPDDLYPQVEIPILQSLADQTAIALSNILQSDRLREYYRSELEIVGSERRRIARDLHESVLNKLANLRNSLDQKTLPPSFLTSYDDLKKRLREIIRNMRPPMLDQGLVFAISDTVEDLREKYEGVNIVLDLSAGEERLPEKVEEYLYYIVHEACQNALEHSNCRTLTISGVISTERVDLSIVDDGDGFDVQAKSNAAIANRHFGLAHMKERAQIIGSELEIQSQPGSGTLLHISWKSE